MMKTSWKYVADRYSQYYFVTFFLPRYAVFATIGERRISIVARFYWFANAKRYAKRMNKELNHLKVMQRLIEFGVGGGGGG